MGVKSQKLRDSARGQRCAFQSPVCNHDPATTVLAHLPSGISGMGTKSHDFNAAFACSSCHEHLDNHRFGSHQMELAYCYLALRETQQIWYEMGLIKIPETTSQSKPLNKTVARTSLFARQP